MHEKVRNLPLASHVGFDSLPDQLVSKSTQKGFIFNILCIGETGLGKSTLMDSLFNTNFDSTPSSHNLPCVQLKSNTYELQESNVTMKLTIVETAGFGDQINKEDSFQAINNYLDSQFEAYLQEELKIRRALNLYHDTRIHVCLYFIAPTGHGLKSLDLVCMKKLDSKVNIIPIIAKADTISKSELAKFKERINAELNSNGIKVYQFPIDDDSVAIANTSMNSHVPFAVIGSTEMIKVGNKLVRARSYPWGVVQIENEVHCDFIKLRECLIRTNMEDLRETTHTKHYELYRKSRLEQMGFSDFDDDNKTPVNFQQTYEKKIMNHQSDLQNKEEEMKQQFIQRVKGKEAELKEAEKELHAKFDQIKDENARDRKRLEDNLKQIEDEIAEFSRLKIFHQTQLLSGHHTLSLGTLGKGKKK